ncbi:MAG TPA: FkbM family methyltransferase [Chitinophagaceae bacterium]|jgi:FkbM family methyltransferase|nr:FkbM family methyltransferase [Chitinophagaceae bacterium]
MIIQILQWLPEFKGKTTICRWLLRNYTKDKKDVVISAGLGLSYKVPNFIEPIGFSILINGAHEPETSDFISKSIRSNGVFMDIGANIGAITLPVCRKRPDLQLLCIEASPKVFTYLNQNVRMNKLDNCILVNKAISDVDGQTVSFFSPPDQHGKGSLTPVFTDKAESVVTTTVDTLLGEHQIDSVDFIKIDIEGYEYYAFKSAEQLLRRKDAPVILFEFIDWAESHARNLTPGDAQRVLMDFGYSIYVFKDGKPQGEPLEKPITDKGLIMLFATKTGLPL